MEEVSGSSLYYASCVTSGKTKIVSYDLNSGDLEIVIEYDNTCYNIGYDPVLNIFMCPNIMGSMIYYYANPEIRNLNKILMFFLLLIQLDTKIMISSTSSSPIKCINFDLLFSCSLFTPY